MISATQRPSRQLDGSNALILGRDYSVPDAVDNSTLLVDTVGQKPNTLDTDLVK